MPLNIEIDRAAILLGDVAPFTHQLHQIQNGGQDGMLDYRYLHDKDTQLATTATHWLNNQGGWNKLQNTFNTLNLVSAANHNGLVITQFELTPDITISSPIIESIPQDRRLKITWMMLDVWIREIKDIFTKKPGNI